jgi:hypothetical protein
LIQFTQTCSVALVVPSEEASAPVTSDMVPITYGVPEARLPTDALVPEDPDAAVVGDELFDDEPQAPAMRAKATTAVAALERRKFPFVADFFRPSNTVIFPTGSLIRLFVAR